MLNYALAGTDMAKFEIDQKTGQITTLVALNYEAGDGEAGQCDTANVCSVMVTATDSAGAPSDPVAIVTITIEDVDEKPNFTDGDQAVFVWEGSVQVRDSGNDRVNDDADPANNYMAEDPEDQLVGLTLMGSDGDLFSLNATRGLSFKTAPDFENPSDANKDNLYEVTVRASDGALDADRMVRVRVNDVDEAPEILQDGLNVSGPSSEVYTENGTAAVGTYTASGSKATSARWTLVEGDDDGDFRLSSSSGMSTMLMFRSSPTTRCPWTPTPTTPTWSR